MLRDYAAQGITSIIGARRAELMLPLASIEASGLPFSIHADLVILSENPLSVDPARLRDLEVRATYVHGRRIYARKK